MLYKSAEWNIFFLPVYRQDQGDLVCQAIVEREHNVKEKCISPGFRGLTSPKVASPGAPFSPFCWRTGREGKRVVFATSQDS